MPIFAQKCFKKLQYKFSKYFPKYIPKFKKYQTLKKFETLNYQKYYKKFSNKHLRIFPFQKILLHSSSEPAHSNLSLSKILTSIAILSKPPLIFSQAQRIVTLQKLYSMDVRKVSGNSGNW